MPNKEPSRPELEEGRSHKGADLNSGLTFGGEMLDSLKAGAHWREDTILRDGIALIRMVTSKPTEIQAEGEISVDEAVKEILAEMEAEEQDPI